MWLVFFRGISGQPSLRRIDRKDPESYLTYGARIFAGETAKGGQDGNFIEKHQSPRALWVWLNPRVPAYAVLAEARRILAAYVRGPTEAHSPA